MLTVEDQPVTTVSPFLNASQLVAEPEVTVISIYPQARSKEFKLAGFLPILKIDAAPKGKWTKMRVGSSFQVIPDVSDLEEKMGSLTLRQAPVAAMNIAMDCVNEWKQSIASRGFPGIEVLPRGIEESPADPSFQRFLAALNYQQAEMAEWLITDAAEKDKSGRQSYITALHRTMATWHLGDKSKLLPWFPQFDVMGTKPCIACGEEIKGVALTCKECGKDLIEYGIKYPQRAARDKVVQAEIERMSVPAQVVTNNPPTAPGNPGVGMQAGADLVPPAPTKRLSAEFQAAVMKVMNADEQRQYTQLSDNSKKAAFLQAMAATKGIKES